MFLPSLDDDISLSISPGLAETCPDIKGTLNDSIVYQVV
jgi:hypothetical protein